jgi:hypothetical protein
MLNYNYSYKLRLNIFFMGINERIEVEENLEKILLKLSKNPKNSLNVQGVITIYHEDKSGEKYPIVNLYLKDKYAHFHDEYTQTVITNPELRPLYDFINEKS